ncbi:F420-dependent NADP oxidoreductase, partial [Acinetobacter baumannii]
QRLTLHLAAVFACNFSNYCFDMAKQVVDAEQVDFSLLYPLILETAKKATENDPKQMQTGPAMRGDQNILAMHQSLLAQANRDDLKKVYQLLSDGIVKRHHSS